MASFKQAMSLAAQQAKNLGAEMKAVSAQFSATDKSEQALTARNDVLTRSLGQSKSALSLVGTELDKKRAKMNELANAVDKASKEYGENSTEVAKAKNAYGNARIEVEKLETKYNSIQGDVNKFSREIENNAQALNGVKSEYQNAGTAADKFGNDVQSSGDKGAIGIGKIVTALGLMKLASKAIDMVKNSISSAFSRIDTMEQFERTMTALTGSAEDSKNALEEVRKTVTGTAYGLDVGAKSVQNFVTSGMSLNSATKQVGLWADAVAFYGDGTNSSLESVTDAIAKMTAAGKVQGDQLNRLTDAGIPVVQMFAAATGKSVADVRAELSKGSISAEEFTSVLGTAMTDGTEGFISIAGAAQEAGASWEGSFDNMKAAITRGMTNVIQKIDEGLSNAGFGSLREIISGIGKNFETVLNSVAEKIPEVITFVTNLYTAIEPFIPLILALATAFVVFDQLRAAQKVIQDVSFSFHLFNQVLKANPILLIISVIAALIAAIIYLWNTNEDFRNAVTAIWETLKSVVNTVVNALVTFFTVTLPGAFTTVIEWFKALPGNIWNFLLETINKVVNWGAETKQKMVDATQNAITAVIEWFTTLPEKIGFALGFVIGKIAQFGIDAWTWVTTELPLIIEGIVVWFSELPDKIWTWLKETIIKIALWGAETAISMYDSAKNAIDSVINWFKELPGNIWTWLLDTISKVISWGSDMATKAKDAAKQTFDNVVNTIKEIPQNMIDTGKNIVKGLWDGITGMGTWLKDKITGFASGIVDGFKGAFGIHSPSTVMKKEVGKDVGLGIGVGVMDAVPQVLKDVKGFVGSIGDVVTDIMPSIAVASPSSISSNTNKAQGTSGGITQFFENVFNFNGGTGNESELLAIAQYVSQHIQEETQRGLRANGTV